MYISYFQDFYGDWYKVQIGATESTAKRLFLRKGDECIIQSKSDNGLFTPVRSKSCTLSVLAKDLIPDLYSIKIFDKPIVINKIFIEENYLQEWIEYGNSIAEKALFTGDDILYNINVSLEINFYTEGAAIFKGYLTPLIYNQDYLHVYDYIELEAVECISALSDLRYQPIGNNGLTGISSAKDIVGNIIQRIGLDEDDISETNTNKLLDNIRLNESNFFSDDVEHLPWTCMEVLEEICKYLGYTAELIYDIDNIDAKLPKLKFINWDEVNRGTDSSLGIGMAEPGETISKDKLVFLGSRHQISMEPTYNKISLSSSIYEIDTLITDPFGDEEKGNLIDITKKDFRQTRMVIKGKNEVDSWQLLYQMFKFDNTKSPWKNWIWIQTFDTDKVTPLFNEALAYPGESIFVLSKTLYQHFGDTLSSYLCRYWVYDEYEGYKAKIDPSKLICINALNYGEDLLNVLKINGSMGTKEVFTQVANIKKLFDKLSDQTVLSYTSPEDILLMAGQVTSSYQEDPHGEQGAGIYTYIPGDGMSFICFKALLYWQNYTKQNKTNFSPWEDRTDLEKRSYHPIPFTDEPQTKISEKIMLERGIKRPSGLPNPAWNHGWPMLPMKVWVEGYDKKYWNGKAWTRFTNTDEIQKFWIYYHKEMMGDFVEDKAKEVFAYNAWMNPVYNTGIYNPQDGSIQDIKTIVGEDYFVIPIDQSLSGKLHVDILCPYQLNIGIQIYDWESQWREYVTGYQQFDLYDFIDYCPLIFLKDLEVSYKHVPGGYNWMSIADYDSGDDVVYTNITNDRDIPLDETIEYDDIELKINSFVEGKPLSRSYVMDNNGKYLKELQRKYYGFKLPEKYIIEYYYNHFATPKIVFQTTVNLYISPDKQIYWKKVGKNNILKDKVFCLDEQRWNVAAGENEIKLIQY